MAQRKKERAPKAQDPCPLTWGATAKQDQLLLHAYDVGALPIVNRVLERLRLEQTLDQHLPDDDVRREIPTSRVALVLLRNLLISREPMYGVTEWMARHAPDLFGLEHDELEKFHDDRIGHCLERLFHGATPDLILAVVRQAVRQFQLSLDELHNDSTSIALHGNYRGAERETLVDGRLLPAITWGFSKDHRPDLKQLLFNLTVSADGGVPVCFHVASGNVADDTTHIENWELLRQLVGSVNFLYVADCKLASHENLAHIAVRHGRFVTVLPATRREDERFRQRLRDEPAAIPWSEIWVRQLEPNDGYQRKLSPRPVDVLRVCDEEQVTSDGFRLFWYHSQRKAELDDQFRNKRVQRAMRELEDLQERLAGSRSRFRSRDRVQEKVNELLVKHRVEELLAVTIKGREQPRYRQTRRGRPSPKSTYHKEVHWRFSLSWQVNHEAWQRAQREDGVFPLVTNDKSLTPLALLQAYKRQPTIEKRFSQLKTDYEVAPVFLKKPSRVQGLLVVYFLALLVQTLLEREVRRKLNAAAQAARGPEEKQEAGTLPIYHEKRRCRRPTTRLLLDAMEPITRYWLPRPDGDDLWMVTSFTPCQERIMRLLDIDPATYGR